MANYGTIKVPRDDYERHNERRKNADLSWADYLDEESVTIESADVDELATELVDMIGAEAGGTQVDDSEIAREVVRSLDYEALSRKVAKKVVADLR